MTKLRVLWNVLRGRPTIYRVEFTDEVCIKHTVKHMLIAECRFTGKASDLPAEKRAELLAWFMAQRAKA